MCVRETGTLQTRSGHGCLGPPSSLLCTALCLGRILGQGPLCPLSQCLGHCEAESLQAAGWLCWIPGSSQQEEGHSHSLESCSSIPFHSRPLPQPLLTSPGSLTSPPLEQMTDYRDDPHRCDQYTEDEDGHPGRNHRQFCVPWKKPPLALDTGSPSLRSAPLPHPGPQPAPGPHRPEHTSLDPGRVSDCVGLSPFLGNKPGTWSRQSSLRPAKPLKGGHELSS